MKNITKAIALIVTILSTNVFAQGEGAHSCTYLPSQMSGEYKDQETKTKMDELTAKLKAGVHPLNPQGMSNRELSEMSGSFVDKVNPNGASLGFVRLTVEKLANIKYICNELINYDSMPDICNRFPSGVSVESGTIYNISQ